MKLVFKSRRCDHVQPLLQALHWLPVQTTVDYKLSTIFHNFFSDSSPVYLSHLLTVYNTPSTQLCPSADTLRIPHVKTKTFGQHSFSYSAPKQWNSLSSDIRHIQSSHAFKTALKTHLYKQYYNKWFQILSSFFLDLLLSCLLHSSLCALTYLCVCVVVCVCVHASVCVARNVMFIYYFEAYVCICRFDWFCKVRCDHPCW